MTFGWAMFVNVLVVINIAGCVWLLWWTSRPHPGGRDPDSTGHVWDGDLTEFDKPLPRWWINLFYITIVFSIGYLVWFPGFGAFTGMSNWSSPGELARDQEIGNAKLAEAFRPYDGKAIDELARDPRAVELGRSIFGNQCATCHGALAQGATGYPNLADGIWHWGGSATEVTQTVLHGRAAQMPGWRQALTSMGGENAVEDVVTYVLSLTDNSLRATNSDAVARGGKLFGSVCAACHGPEGKGNALLGSPDLTDDYWLYGRSRATVRDAIDKGRNGVMPAQVPLIGETRARLAAAYVWSLSHPGGTSP
jgi:cytochrome c oxidase cbb3-type subunit III